MHGRYPLMVSLGLAVGCGNAPLGSDESSGSDGGESIGAGSSAGESSGGGTTAPIDEGPDCAPADPSLALRFEISGEFGDTCVVAPPIEGAAIAFDCESFDGPPTSASVIVDVEPQLPILIAVGAEVTIERVQSHAAGEEPVARSSIFVRHGVTNELVFAAIDANDLDWTSELLPLTLEPIDDACTSQPDDANCRTTERLMWNAQHGDTIVAVGDASRSDVGGYAVHIQRAVDGALLECLDLETDFYEALIVRTQ